MAQKPKKPSIDVNALGVSGVQPKEKPKSRARGCLKWAVLLLIGACGFSYLVSPPKPKTDGVPTPTLGSTVVANIVATVAEGKPTDVPTIAATVPPTTVATETPVPTATIVVVPTGEFDPYISELKAGIAPSVVGRDIQNMVITREGDQLKLTLTYNSIETDANAQADEIINLFQAVGFYMYLHNVERDDDVDTITLIKNDPTSPISITATATDTINFAANPNKHPQSTFIASLVVDGVSLSSTSAQTLSTTNQVVAATAVPTTSTSSIVVQPVATTSTSSVAVQPMTARSYYAQANGANIRTCPETQCEALVKLESGQSFTAEASTTGQAVNEGNTLWYQVTWQGRVGYVYSGVVGNTPPSVTSSTQNNTVGGQSQSTVPVTQNQSVPANAAAVCGSFDYSQCSKYQTPRNCDEVRTMGIPSRDAACCFPDRDGDKDGDACYE